MSSFALRLLAVLCMVVDHVGLALFPSIGAFRCVGRLAFPLYCFLLTQGFLHTRDIRAYARRLLLTALLSEVPFDLLIFGRVSCMVEQNVLFSLLLALLALIALQALRERPLYALLALMSLCVGAMAARVSFGWVGIALCACFYLTDGQKCRSLPGMVLILLLYALSQLLSGVAHSWVLISLCALLAAIPIGLYSGRRGPRTPMLTALFYAAYPLHLLALVLVRALRLIPPYFLS